MLNVYKENYRKHKEWKFNKPRRIAQAFIQKKEVREEVFEIHGKICLCCGSEKDITIDHIVPVFKDGENSIDNLQPLCRSCNSRKSTNEIDYR